MSDQKERRPCPFPECKGEVDAFKAKMLPDSESESEFLIVLENEKHIETCSLRKLVEIPKRLFAEIEAENKE